MRDNLKFLLLIIIHFVYGQGEVLVHVQTIFRHGDRAPFKLLPGDSNKTNLWPNGLGQLTDTGINQQFQLGQWLRRRYKGFLSRKYEHDEIYVRSTDVDRTLMSAQSNLAGLYYNDKNNIVIPDVKWRPIPIHTIPKIDDIVMVQSDCEKYNNKIKEMFENPKFKLKLEKYRPTLNYLRKAVNDSHLKFENIWTIYDVLFAEQTHNITWNELMTPELYNELSILNQLSWKTMYHGDELAKLSGGLFLNEIISHLKNISTNSFSRRKEKLRMYSSHDTGIAALMSAIGVYDGIQPPYASCFIIELWSKTQRNNDDFENLYVRMFYKNSTEYVSPATYELHLKSCKHDACTLSEFINLVRPRTLSLSEYQQNCSPEDDRFLAGIIVTIYLLFIIFIYIFFKIYIRQRY